MLLRDGLESGDWLATSRLPYVPNGAPVEIIEPTVAESPDGQKLDPKES